MKIKRLITRQDPDDNLARYFSDIRDFESLTGAEEAKLLKDFQKNGTRAALTKVVNANLKFVVSVAKHYQGQGAPLMDCIAEGNLGLIEAAGRFDHTRGLKFFSYAIWWIRIKIFTSLDLHKRII